MAKGRKFTTSRSERFLGSFGHNQSSETVSAAPDLGEDEVWSMIDDTAEGDHGSNGDWNSRSSMESFGSFNSLRSHRGDHYYHHRGGQVGGLSLAFDDSSKTSSPRIVHQFRGKDSVAESRRGRHVATSAPVNVPDWSKIYRVDSVDSLHDFDDSTADDPSDMVPPHEYLARSRKLAANSVFEGVGRTLKGRDMSRVRDAVWSQTGFNG
ncbi:hypothetical protein Adt_42991 [Abeliophyllum distichum]|uniref:Senescence regulator n=1 Tax=Abeliophyllum distichum TaxID=126358 RepID=A0ABD1PTE7_9LAMI